MTGNFRRNKISIRLCYKITSKQFICFNLGREKATTWGLCLGLPLCTEPDSLHNEQFSFNQDLSIDSSHSKVQGTHS
jgi:hypothetical protein